MTRHHSGRLAGPVCAGQGLDRQGVRRAGQGRSVGVDRTRVPERSPSPSCATVDVGRGAAALGRRGCVLVAAAVLTGQLSIGWCNDLVDRDRDRAAGRTDKPLATGAVPPRLVAAACGARRRGVRAALAGQRLAGRGWRTWSAVAGGWAYDLGLKRTVLVLAAVRRELRRCCRPSSRSGLPGHPAPPPGGGGRGACWAPGAHFLNVVPDVEADLAAGVRGLPQRLGAARSAVVGAVLLARGRRWSSPSAPGGRRGGPGPGWRSPSAARPAPGVTGARRGPPAYAVPARRPDRRGRRGAARRPGSATWLIVADAVRP